MGAIITFLGQLLVKVLSDKLILMAALKSMLLFLTVMVLPAVLYKWISGMLNEYLAWLLAKMSTVAGPEDLSLSMALTGYGGWMAIKLKLVDSISLVLSALNMRLFMLFIPFIK